MNPVLALGLTQILGYGSLYYAFPELAPGLPADLVVYPEEPEDLPVTDLPDLRPSLVLFGGKIVHQV